MTKLSAPSPPTDTQAIQVKSGNAGRWLVPILVVTGLLISAALAYQQHLANNERLLDALQTRALQIADDTKQRMADTAHGLRGARGYVLGTGIDRLSTPGFRGYFATRNLPEEFPGVLGVGVIRRVSPDAEPIYVEHVRALGNPDFSVRSLSPHSGERRIIEFVEPLDSNRAAVGLDTASEASRLRTTELALQAENDQPVLTAPIRLVQSAPGSSLGMLMVLRFTDSMRSSLFGVADGPAGFVYSPIQLDELMGAGLAASSLVQYQVSDVTPGGPEQSYGLPWEASANGLPGLTALADREIMGRTWRFEARPTPELIASLHLVRPEVVLAAGALLTVLLAMLMSLRQSLQRRTAGALAERMRLKTLLDNATDAIVGVSLTGRVELWNQAATRLFGYEPAEAVHQEMLALIGTDETREEQQKLIALALNGQSQEPRETARRHKDGHLVAVEVSISPVMDVGTNIVGAAIVLRPIQERLEQVRRLKAYGEELEAKVADRTKALQKLSHDLQQLINGVPALIGAGSKEGQVRYVNRALSDVLDLAAGSGGDQDWNDIMPRLLGEQGKGMLENVLQGNSLQLELSPPMRPSLCLDVRFVPDRSHDGTVDGFFMIATDVSAIRSAERRMSNIIDATGVGTWEWNVATGETRFNARWAEIIGYTLEELAPISIDTWAEHAHPDDLLRSNEALQRHFSGETERYDCEVRMRHKDGRWVWVHDRGQVISHTAEGQPEWMFGTHADITLRKQAEAQNAELHELMSSMLRAAPIAVRITRNSDRKTLFANEQFSNLVRLPPAEAAALDASELLVNQEEIHEIRDLLGKGQTVTNRLLQLRLPYEPHQPNRWVLGSFMPVDFVGESATLGWLFDVTQLREAREAARQAREVQSQALEATQMALAIFDAQDRLEYINQRMVEMYPLVKDKFEAGIAFETFARTITAAYRKQDDPTIEDWTSHRLESHRPGSTWTRKLGDGRTIRVIERELSDRRFVSLRMDVTELTAAQQAAEEASKAKSGFLASTSHEIRTPLNAILGLTYLLEQQRLPETAAQQVRRISQAGHTLLGLLNDVLDFSKIEAQQLWIEKEPVALRQLITDEVDMLAGGHGRQDLTVSVQMDPQVPATVEGDAQRLRQILNNLVSNAIKFTRKGSVIVAVRPADQYPTVEIRVQDTGIGMSEEVQQRLFRPFEQADSSISRRFGGTGLGLSITAKLVELMGGTISVLSAPGEGTTFIVQLPLPTLDNTDGSRDQAAETIEAGSEQAWLPGVRLLVVDDSPLNLEVARSVLALEGADVTTADNGPAAIELLSHSAASFDAVLLDVMMPDMDGIEVVRRIRANPAHQALPVIALTAGVLREQRDAALKAGMSEFLQKPLDPPRMIECLRRLIQARRGQRLPTAQRRRTPEHTAVAAAAPLCAGIDEQRLVEPLRQDRALLVSLIRQLVSSFRQMDLQDPDNLGAALHRIKGSASTVGASEIAETAARAESAWLAAKADPALPAMLRHLCEQMDALAHWLEEQPALTGMQGTEATEDTPPLDDHQLAELQGLLEDGDTCSLTWVEERRGALMARYGSSSVQDIMQALDMYDFDAALGLLAKASARTSD